MSISIAIAYIRRKLEFWKAAFEEAKHHRDENGKFSSVGAPPDKSDKEAFTKYLRALVRQNAEQGMSREEAILKKLSEQYPNAKIYKQCYLCDNLGRQLKDPVSGEARRLDLLVVQGGKALKPIEVTSRKASKSTQMNKEKRIRQAQKESGKDLYAQIGKGDVIKIPYSLKTRVWRTEDFAA